MITAEEARAATEAVKKKPLVEEIAKTEDEIRSAVNMGNSEIPSRKLTKQMRQILIGAGYTVEALPTPSEYKGEDFNYRITWS